MDDLEMLGHPALAKQVAEAHGLGISVGGCLPREGGVDAMVDYAREHGAEVVLLPDDLPDRGLLDRLVGCDRRRGGRAGPPRTRRPARRADGRRPARRPVSAQQERLSAPAPSPTRPKLLAVTSRKMRQLAAGTNPEIVSEVLGHKEVAITLEGSQASARAWLEVASVGYLAWRAVA